MPYTNDMQTLAQVVSPVDAAVQMGTQNQLENQAKQLENERYAGQNPAEIARPGLQNLFTQAQTSSQQGVAQQEQAKGAEAQALLPGQIKTGQAELGTKYNAAQVQQFGQMGQMAGQVAGMLDNIPPAARPAAMNQIAQQYGIDPSKLGPLMSGDPDQLRNFSQKMIQSSQAYQEKMMEEQTRGQYQESVAGITGQAHLAATQELTRGREAVAQTNAETKKALAPLTAVIGELTAKAAAGTATPQEKQILQWAQNSQQLIRSGSPFQAGITGTNVQGNVPAVPGGGGNAPAAAPQAAAGPMQGPATENLAKSAFGAYEPDKYEYGINPATGNFGRRPK
jgi:hypothetical protein